MTCIVGVRHRGNVYVGGDSAGVAGYDLVARSDVKVFRNGPYVMGFTTSFRMGQLLQHAFTPPKPTGPLGRFMVTTFVDAVRTCLKDGGWLTKTNDQESGGTFLVGVAGELFAVHSDFQIAQYADDYAAVGCGSDLALGALHATANRSPRYRIQAALEAAAHHSTSVSAPFLVERSK